ncbi:hypothetical protein CALCODRAFT_519051 [Calocera cornea HHB12733]|uniref:Uncharacterized protein n=1 Tax=Calocera cornea HHB12733 TaxID=1353952 RepID=A0A165EHV5_9BASI|nr:hypothetical protein CALCODRAFT_519051 [Calocera cornea HHB12733]
MSGYLTVVAANSPLLTYDPPVGANALTGWVSEPVPGQDAVQYVTSASKASVSFDFYGTEFSLSGYLNATSESPPCDFNVTINDQLQNITSLYHKFDKLPLEQYHVELALFCPQSGQQAVFTGPAFYETQGTWEMDQIDPYINASQVQTTGIWQEEVVFQEYFSTNITQFTTASPGSSLTYSFKGVHTVIYGAVGPSGGDYMVTLDGVSQLEYSTFDTVGHDAVVLFFAQQLNNDKTHSVLVTTLGGELVLQAIQYTELLPPVPPPTGDA